MSVFDIKNHCPMKRPNHSDPLSDRAYRMSPAHLYNGAFKENSDMVRSEITVSFILRLYAVDIMHVSIYIYIHRRMYIYTHILYKILLFPRCAWSRWWELFPLLPFSVIDNSAQS